MHARKDPSVKDETLLSFPPLSPPLTIDARPVAAPRSVDSTAARTISPSRKGKAAASVVNAPALARSASKSKFDNSNKGKQRDRVDKLLPSAIISSIDPQQISSEQKLNGLKNTPVSSIVYLSSNDSNIHPVNPTMEKPPLDPTAGLALSMASLDRMPKSWGQPPETVLTNLRKKSIAPSSNQSTLQEEPMSTYMRDSSVDLPSKGVSAVKGTLDMDSKTSTVTDDGTNSSTTDYEDLDVSVPANVNISTPIYTKTNGHAHIENTTHNDEYHNKKDSNLLGLDSVNENMLVSHQDFDVTNSSARKASPLSFRLDRYMVDADSDKEENKIKADVANIKNGILPALIQEYDAASSTHINGNSVKNLESVQVIDSSSHNGKKSHSESSTLTSTIPSELTPVTLDAPNSKPPMRIILEDEDDKIIYLPTAKDNIVSVSANEHIKSPIKDNNKKENAPQGIINDLFNSFLGRRLSGIKTTQSKSPSVERHMNNDVVKSDHSNTIDPSTEMKVQSPISVGSMLTTSKNMTEQLSHKRRSIGEHSIAQTRDIYLNKVTDNRKNLSVDPAIEMIGLQKANTSNTAHYIENVTTITDLTNNTGAAYSRAKHHQEKQSDSNSQLDIFDIVEHSNQLLVQDTLMSLNQPPSKQMSPRTLVSNSNNKKPTMLTAVHIPMLSHNTSVNTIAQTNMSSANNSNESLAHPVPDTEHELETLNSTIDQLENEVQVLELAMKSANSTSLQVATLTPLSPPLPTMKIEKRRSIMNLPSSIHELERQLSPGTSVPLCITGMSLPLPPLKPVSIVSPNKQKLDQPLTSSVGAHQIFSTVSLSSDELQTMITRDRLLNVMPKSQLQELLISKKHLLKKMSEASIKGQVRLSSSGLASQMFTARNFSLDETLKDSAHHSEHGMVNNERSRRPKALIMASKELTLLENMTQGMKMFNVLPAHGLRYLGDCNLLFDTEQNNNNEDESAQSKQAKQIARFLLKESNSGGLNKVVVGRYLTEPYQLNTQVLKAYIELISFEPMSLEGSLRTLLINIRLPNTARAATIVVEAFAQHWWKEYERASSSSLMPTTRDSTVEIWSHESVRIVSFALLQLNMDLHDERHKRKIKRKEFCKNVSHDVMQKFNMNLPTPDSIRRGSNAFQNQLIITLRDMYDSIARESLTLDDENDQFFLLYKYFQRQDEEITRKRHELEHLEQYSEKMMPLAADSAFASTESLPNAPASALIRLQSRSRRLPTLPPPPTMPPPCELITAATKNAAPQDSISPPQPAESITDPEKPKKGIAGLKQKITHKWKLFSKRK